MIKDQEDKMLWLKSRWADCDWRKLKIRAQKFSTT